VLAVEIALAGVGPELEKELSALALRSRREGPELYLTARDEAAADELVRRAVAGRAKVRSLVPTRESLEDYFLRVRQEAGASGSGKEDGA
jgi:hypothetical protein